MIRERRIIGSSTRSIILKEIEFDKLQRRRKELFHVGREKASLSNILVDQREYSRMKGEVFIDGQEQQSDCQYRVGCVA